MAETVCHRIWLYLLFFVFLFVTVAGVICVYFVDSRIYLAMATRASPLVNTAPYSAPSHHDFNENYPCHPVFDVKSKPDYTVAENAINDQNEAGDISFNDGDNINDANSWNHQLDNTKVVAELFQENFKNEEIEDLETTQGRDEDDVVKEYLNVFNDDLIFIWNIILAVSNLVLLIGSIFFVGYITILE